MTSRAIRRLRQRSSLNPASSKAPQEVRDTYKTWCNLIQRYRRWIFDTPRDQRDLSKPLVTLEWVASFDTFYQDMGPKPAGLAIQRRDSNAPYGPQNCYWGRTRKRGPAPRILITYNNQTRSIPEWSRELGIPTGVLYERHSRGYSHAAILGLVPQEAC